MEGREGKRKENLLDRDKYDIRQAVAI